MKDLLESIACVLPFVLIILALAFADYLDNKSRKS